jgi:peptidyl-prolyl cis-trans isomerase A (cyclophilin A)
MGAFEMADFGTMLRAGRVVAVLGVLAGMAASAQTIDANTYAFNTTQGTIYVELRPDAAPKNVTNFLSYVNSGAYSNSIVHRLVTGFIAQGGGYDVVNGTVNAIPTKAAVVSEYNLSNTAGTLAMALSGGANTATNQWFFNVVDNSSSLNTQSGGYTVIGQIVDPAGYSTAGESMAVLQAINADHTVDDSASLGSAFTQLPVLNYTSGTLTPSNLVYVNSITQVQGVNVAPPVVSNVSGSSLSSGQTVTATVEVTGYAPNVSIVFACSALPTNSKCTFSPNPVVTGATGTATTSLTLATGVSPNLVVGPTAAGFGGGWLAVALGVMSLWFVTRRRGVMSRAGMLRLVVVMGLGTLLLASGCGSGASPGASGGGSTSLVTPTGSYSVGISATGGARSSSTTLAVTVH